MDLNRKYRIHEKLERVHAGPFVQSRSILTRVEVKRGRYCLLPSTFDPHREGQYLIRLYTQNSLAFRSVPGTFPVCFNV